MTTWTLRLPYLTPPLSLNSRMHWRVKARIVAQVRADVATLARAAKIPACPSVTVLLHYRPRDRRRRDSDNLVAAQKPMLDGLVDAGVVPDDCAPFLAWLPPALEEPVTGQPGAMWLTVSTPPVPTRRSTR